MHRPDEWWTAFLLLTGFAALAAAVLRQRVNQAQRASEQAAVAKNL
jgi:hypothetical protein